MNLNLKDQHKYFESTKFYFRFLNETKLLFSTAFSHLPSIDINCYSLISINIHSFK
jgi:hypothetical protein